MKAPLSGYGYRAFVERDFNGWASNTVRLLVVNNRGPHMDILCGDAIRSVPEGDLIPDDAGIVLPAEAVEAIVQAFAEYQGHASHAETEARVLREWLAVERARVDRSLRGGDVP